MSPQPPSLLVVEIDIDIVDIYKRRCATSLLLVVVILLIFESAALILILVVLSGFCVKTCGRRRGGSVDQGSAPVCRYSLLCWQSAPASAITGAAYWEFLNASLYMGDS